MSQLEKKSLSWSINLISLGLKEINKDEYLEKPIHIAKSKEAVKTELTPITSLKVE